MIRSSSWFTELAPVVWGLGMGVLLGISISTYFGDGAACTRERAACADLDTSCKELMAADRRAVAALDQCVADLKDDEYRFWAQVGPDGCIAPLHELMKGAFTYFDGGTP
jgi:hypothetical protein